MAHSLQLLLVLVLTVLQVCNFEVVAAWTMTGSSSVSNTEQQSLEQYYNIELNALQTSPSIGFRLSFKSEWDAAIAANQMFQYSGLPTSEWVSTYPSQYYVFYDPDTQERKHYIFSGSPPLVIDTVVVNDTLWTTDFPSNQITMYGLLFVWGTDIPQSSPSNVSVTPFRYTTSNAEADGSTGCGTHGVAVTTNMAPGASACLCQSQYSGSGCSVLTTASSCDGGPLQNTTNTGQQIIRNNQGNINPLDESVEFTIDTPQVASRVYTSFQWGM